MSYKVSSLETHHAIAAHRSTNLPIRAIVGQWVRELGIANGIAVFPGPRKNPGNVTTAHVGRVCGYLTGGSATEQHNFPVYCTVADGVGEYSWYYNNLHYYTDIAPKADGDWSKACDLIEESPWSSDHYGHTLDVTAMGAAINIGETAPLAVGDHLTVVRALPKPESNVVAEFGEGRQLAIMRQVVGAKMENDSIWWKVRVGPGSGKIGYIRHREFHTVTV